MAYLPGTGISLGIGREGTRGTYQAPSIYMPMRAPTTLHAITDKVQIRETSGSPVPSTGAAIIQKRVEGEAEFNLRSRSIGYLLLSLFGSVSTSTLATGVYQHVFSLLAGNPQYPTLSLLLAQPGFQDYKYLRNIVRSLEVRTPVDDLVNATAGFIGASESAQADVSPSLSDDDAYFRPSDVAVKFASAVAGIAGATATKLKENSFTINNNARVNQNISEQTPGDVLAIMTEITGSFGLDYQDETFHDLYVAGTVRAMEIKMTRADIDLGTGINPSLTFLMPQITLDGLEPDRPIDDIVRENIEWNAHLDMDAGYAITATLVNDKANYTT